MRERWGTFSVRDHMIDAPFVSDVLLYDRLIIPVPPTDGSQDRFWIDFEPEKQQRCLDILKIKTEENEGLALAVPWDTSKRERFTNRMSAAVALATQKRSPDQTYYSDPFEMTRVLIKNEFLPVLPMGVSKAWTMAAFTSIDSYAQEVSAAGQNQRRQLAAVITHQFLTPATSDPDHDILKKAVDLATSDDFRRKRASFYTWQEEIVEYKISDAKAVEELEKRLKQYNEVIRKEFEDTIARFAFMVIPIALSITGTLLKDEGIVLTGTGGLVSLANYFKFNRKPDIESGDLDAVAMIHDAKKKLSL